MTSIGTAIYLIVGMIVAGTKEYLSEISGIGDIINLILAVVLWPLVLLGVKFNLKLGGGKDDNDALAQASLLLGPPLVFARAALSSLTARH